MRSLLILSIFLLDDSVKKTTRRTAFAEIKLARTHNSREIDLENDLFYHYNA